MVLQRRHQGAAAAQQAVGEGDHAGVGPRARADLEHPVKGIRLRPRLMLRQQDGGGGGGAGQAYPAMDQQVVRLLLGQFLAEADDGLDMVLLRAVAAGEVDDMVVEAQDRAPMAPEMAEGGRIGHVRVQDRQGVADPGGAVVGQFMHAADGELRRPGGGMGRHGRRYSGFWRRGGHPHPGPLPPCGRGR